jgi:hypothetical protein
MPPRYSSTQQVADYLGTDLTGLQSIEADRLLLAAESWIDGRTGRTWGVTASTTETQTIAGQALYLRITPVASVTSVSIRSTYVNAAWSAVSYELLDAAQGLVLLPWGYAGWLAQVVYVPAQTVDPRVSLAATKLTAHWLQPTITGEAVAAGGSTSAVKSYAIGSELNVTYDTATSTTTTTTSTSTTLKGIPDDVVALVDGLREWVLA